MNIRASIELVNGELRVGSNRLISGMPDNISALEDAAGVGILLKVKAPEALSRHVIPLGRLAEIQGYTCCHRYEPYWMLPSVGKGAGDIPVETQFLLAELSDGNCALFVPILDGAFRAALQGAGDDDLEIVVESGDPLVVGQEFTPLFIAVGDDPYQLMESAAQSVMSWMGTGRLRRDKPLPDFIDYFGWCTWDAFYKEVDPEKIRQGLESFSAIGIPPKTLILDDGWQTVERMPTGEDRLTSFSPNEKFAHDLSATVQMAKDVYGVCTFIVWHALPGYWGGTHPVSFPNYLVDARKRDFSPGILHYYPDHNDMFSGEMLGIVASKDISRFFLDYHRSLRRQGVDGVKVDVQASLEGAAAGSGGRVNLAQRYHEALEGSAHVHFGGRLINCMSCSNDILYSTLNSTLTRTSTDFWPDRPESHGMHLYTNALVSLWFGEFVHPDWDMFQSGHPMGSFHAAGRAISGGPVYVSDRPGEQNEAVLRKLVLEDGSILRAKQPALPTPDCLFHDPTQEPVLLKIFSHNEGAGIVGVFNCRTTMLAESLNPVSGLISPRDIPGLQGDIFAVYAHNASELRILEPGDGWEISLPELTWELFTIVPIRSGVAPIGLADMYNSSGAVVDKEMLTPDLYQITARGSGRFLTYCRQPPLRVTIDGIQQEHHYTPNDGKLEFALHGPGLKKIRIHW